MFAAVGHLWPAFSIFSFLEGVCIFSKEAQFQTLPVFCLLLHWSYSSINDHHQLMGKKKKHRVYRYCSILSVATTTTTTKTAKLLMGYLGKGQVTQYCQFRCTLCGACLSTWIYIHVEYAIKQSSSDADFQYIYVYFDLWDDLEDNCLSLWDLLPGCYLWHLNPYQCRITPYALWVLWSSFVNVVNGEWCFVLNSAVWHTTKLMYSS